MAWGQTKVLEGAGICPFCQQPKAGTKTGPVGGGGWGSQCREGMIACCINPNCSEGRKNPAK
ncbi:MAG: hypothetical protein WC768_03335 [Patescibacteria group bacterium]